MKKYDYIEALVEKHRVPFAIDGSVSIQEIEMVEQRISFQLPDSYRWWLSKYGIGQIGSSAINSPHNSTDPMDFVHSYFRDVELGIAEPRVLNVMSSDDEDFWLDTTAMQNQECPVLVSEYGPHPKEPYASSFEEFLIRRIRWWYEGGK